MDLKNKKILVILVTGADGFIGSHLTEMLIQKGAKVKALSYYPLFAYFLMQKINFISYYFG